MSLAEQSQQWYPTSVQVTVLQARNLRVKGKNGTNDAYAIIQVAKDKFSTAVVEKCVEPVWKEEATFDLPLFHRGNAERCTLYIVVMHRALVGMDKLLGQAVINLLDLQDDKARKKTDWYKLLDKNSKADKERGEVLLDIQFMRNNMTASMFDLSMPDKPRSRISKFKDKVRGKKKDGHADSASAIVPATVGQVLTDSEGEEEGSTDSPKLKKSSKFKSLFGSKTNLHRGVSQSMSTLGTLPEKNSSLTSSRSSGLNEESAEGKNKFKFLGHKRNGSTDSKLSLGPFSLLNRSKQSTPENNLCINGSHVYAEDQESKPDSGSSLSLSGSAKGSVEDLRKYHERNASTGSTDSFKGLSIPSYKPDSAEREFQVQHRPQEDDEKKHKKAEGRLQELLDEQERKKQQEQEERRRKLEEDDGKMQQERERKRQADEEQQRKRREEEARKAEEQKRQEESRVTDRLTSLFGLGRKKEEQIAPAVESPKQADVPASINPFEEIPLSSDNPDPEEKSAELQKDVRTAFTPIPPSSGFPARTVKVSAVRPRLTLSQKTETDNTDFLASPVPSDIQNSVPTSTFPPEASSPSDPFESFDMFSNLHSSMAPPKPQRTFSDSSTGSTENLPGANTDSLSEKKRRAPQSPSYPWDPFKNEKHHPKNGVQVNSPTSEKIQQPSLPLPDYEALFPKKRHGVMTNTRWEHVIAEVNQRKMTFQDGEKEMSVDGPGEPISNKSSILKERNTSSLDQHPRDDQVVSSVSTKRMEPKPPLIPPKPANLATSKQHLEVNSEQGRTHERLYSVHGEKTKTDLERNPKPSIQSPEDAQTNVKGTLNPIPDLTLDHISVPKKEKPTPTARSAKKSTSPADQSCDVDTTELPLAKPRQGAPSKEPVRQVQPEQSMLAFTSSASSQAERKNAGSVTTKSLWEDVAFEEGKLIPVNNTERAVNVAKEQPFTNVTNALEKQMTEVDPFPSDELISRDPWALPQQTMDQDDFFTGGLKKGKKLEDPRLSSDDFDNIFGSVASQNEMDPFFVPKDEANMFFESVGSKDETDMKKSHNSSPSSQEVYSQKKKLAPKPPEKPVIKDAVLQEADVEITVSSLAGPKGGETANSLFSAFPELLSGSASGGKSTLCAWVPPSEVQSGTSHSSGSGGVLTSRRPHPVKPLSPYESQSPASISMGKDLKIQTIREVAEKSKRVESGPYTQLTQEELITLVVKQQTELSKKDEKIVELEEYIDNLLVRIIDEKPSILLAMNSKV